MAASKARRGQLRGQRVRALFKMKHAKRAYYHQELARHNTDLARPCQEYLLQRERKLSEGEAEMSRLEEEIRNVSVKGPWVARDLNLGLEFLKQILASTKRFADRCDNRRTIPEYTKQEILADAKRLLSLF